MYVKWQISIIKTLGGDFDTKLCLDKKRRRKRINNSYKNSKCVLAHRLNPCAATVFHGVA